MSGNTIILTKKQFEQMSSLTENDLDEQLKFIENLLDVYIRNINIKTGFKYQSVQDIKTKIKYELSISANFRR